MAPGGIAFDDAAGRAEAGLPVEKSQVTWAGPDLLVTAYVKTNPCTPSTVQFHLQLPASIAAQQFGSITLIGTGMPSGSYALTNTSRVPWTSQSLVAPAAVSGWWSPEITPTGVPTVTAIRLFTREFEAGVTIPVTQSLGGRVVPPSMGSWAGACAGTRTVCVRRLNADGSTGPVPPFLLSAIQWQQGTPEQNKVAYAVKSLSGDRDLRFRTSSYVAFRRIDGNTNFYALQATPQAGGEIGNFQVATIPLNTGESIVMPTTVFGTANSINDVDYFQSGSWVPVTWGDLVDTECRSDYWWGRASGAAFNNLGSTAGQLPTLTGLDYPVGASPITFTCGGVQCAPPGAPELSVCGNNCAVSGSPAIYTRDRVHQWNNDTHLDLSRMCGYSLAWDITNTYPTRTPMTARAWGSATKVVGDPNWTITQNLALTGMTYTAPTNIGNVLTTETVRTTAALTPSGKVKFELGLTARRYDCQSCGWYATGFQLDAAPYGLMDIFAGAT